MASSNLGTLESGMKCSICLGDFTEPRILPCLHTLCRGCLEIHVSASGQGEHFNCPSCLHKCQVPKGGLSAIPKNFFLTNVRDLLEEQRPRNTTAGGGGKSVTEGCEQHRQCDNTKKSKTQHDKAVVFCVECGQFFCASCESIHEMFDATSDHRVRRIGVDEQQRMPPCDQHPTQKLDLYCETCHVPICMKCCLLTHNQHKYTELGTGGREEDTMSELGETAGQPMDTLIQDKMAELEAAHQNLTNQAVQEVNQTAAEIIDLLTKREQYILQQIRDSEKKALTEVQAALEETERNKASTQCLQTYMQALQVSGDVTDQVVHTPGLKEQLRQQQTMPLRTVSWKANFKRDTSNVAALDAMLGTVSTETCVVTKSDHAAPVDGEQTAAGSSNIPETKFN